MSLLTETVAACTIVSKNYFAYAKTLAASFLKYHKGHSFFILVVDEAVERERFICDGAIVVFLEDMQLPDWRNIAFKFDIMELNTNVKPSFLQMILNRGISKVLYLDPDISVYESLVLVYNELDTCNVVLTPHSLHPISGELRPVDRDFLKCGAYNLGFIGVSATSETRKFLQWWGQRCLNEGFNEVSMGWFVDQKWIDLAPCYFSGVTVLRNPGCNVAYWNLHERQMVERRGISYVLNDGIPLLFFHFSGIHPHDNLSISRHQNRFDLANRPDLKPLFAEYRTRLLKNDYDKFQKEKYAFGEFEDGRRISPLMRRMAAALPGLQGDIDPFKVNSMCHRFALKQNLTYRRDSKLVELGTVNSMTVDFSDRRLWWMGKAIKMSLKLLGVKRFQALSRFLRHFSVPNNLALLIFPQFKK